MATIVTRSGKGSPLTHAEVDSNFTNLNTDKLELSGGTMTGNLSFGDNDKAIFGAGSDLQIYHDGSDSYVTDQGTGNLRIMASNLRIGNAAQTANYILANDGGGVTLNHSGSSKFVTTSTGIDVTGTVTADGLTVDGPFTVFNNTGGSQIYDFKSDHYTQIQLTSDVDASAGGPYTQQLTGNGNNGSLELRTGTVTRQSIAQNGDISFYEDTGTTAKFFWDASAESLGIGTSSPASIIHSLHPTSPKLTLERDSTSLANNNVIGEIAMAHKDSNDAGTAVRIIGRAEGTGGAAGLAFNTGLPSSTVERMRIDSSGNVGIGTTSPSQSWTGGTARTVQLQGPSSTITVLRVNEASDTYGDLQLISGASNEVALYNFNNGAMRFGTNGTERMRIDSSGNLLVGKTSANYATVGAQILNTGIGEFTASSVQPLTLRRNTTDGDIVKFYKDGTTVGSIKSRNSESLMIGSDYGSDAYICLSNDNVFPVTSTGAVKDGATNLGVSTGRWKDLYLSGGVYLGGTGAANKLDDYETGEFTATISCGSGTIAVDVGQRKCAYTKIGKLVHIQGSLGMGAISSPSGEFRIVGAPFVMDTSLGDQAEISAASVALYEMASNITGLLNAEISMDAGVATILIRDNGGQTTSVQNIANKFDSNSIVRFSVQYMTT